MPKRPANSASVLEHASLGFAALGLLMLLSFPAMRGVSETFGWLPFWLLALPLSAWAVARALRGPADAASPSASVHPIGASHTRPHRAAAPQALRRAA